MVKSTLPETHLMFSDIILFRGGGIVGQVIRWATGSHWNHAAVYAGTWLGTKWIIEAAVEEVRAFPLHRRKDRERLVLRAMPAERLKALMEKPVKTLGELDERIVQYCVDKIGKRYDFWSYPRLMLRALKLRFNWLPWKVEPLKNELFYCFELVAKAYEAAGIPLNGSDLALPRDFYNAVMKRVLWVVEGGIRP